MKFKLIFAASLFAIVCPIVHAQNTPAKKLAESPFDPTKIWHVHVTVSPDEYAAMQPLRGGLFSAAPKPKDPKRKIHKNSFGVDLPWAKGEVSIEGQTFKNVDLRYKGNGTIQDAENMTRKSIRIELDKNSKDRFFGMRTINLHSGVADPTRIRETIGYGLYRAAGVPSPRTTLAEVRLTVPGKFDKELLGVYTIVEHVGGDFLEANFGSDKGLLMKPEMRGGGSLDSGVRDFSYRGDSWDAYKKLFEPRREATKEEAERLIAFIKLIHKSGDAEFAKKVGDYLDIDNYLRYVATTAFISNMDSFLTIGHNVFLYLHPKTGRIHVFPWDVDRAFANLPFFGSPAQQMELSFTHPYGGVHRLTDRLFAMPEMKDRYQTLLKDLAATHFEKQRLLRDVEAKSAAVKELIKLEAEAAKKRKESPAVVFGGSAPNMTTFVERRTKSLANQIAGTSKGFVPGANIALRAGDMMGPPVMEIFDADKDGNLSKAEWTAVIDKMFATADKEKRGWVRQLDVATAINDLVPKNNDGGPRPGLWLAKPLMTRVDADKDGKATREEFTAAANKLFADFDADKRGMLSADSLNELLTELFPLPAMAKGSEKK
jgi:spore coat protein H